MVFFAAPRVAVGVAKSLDEAHPCPAATVGGAAAPNTPCGVPLDRSETVVKTPADVCPSTTTTYGR